jgi:hypothetical protein
VDKEEFKQSLGKFFSEKNVKSIKKLEPDMVVICTKGKDFDPKTNALWDAWGNKSAVRDDVRCCGCCEALAVSNWAYRQYIAMDEKARPYCIECAGEVIKAEAEAEEKAKQAQSPESEDSPKASPSEPEA